MRNGFTGVWVRIGLVPLLCAALLTPCSRAQADLIIFNLGGDLNGTTVEGATSGTLIVNGLTALFTANDGLLNASTTNFGINATGPGDAADMLDAGSGIEEYLTITFDQPIAFTQLSLDSFSGSERASLTIGLNPTLLLDATPAGMDVFNFLNSDLAMGNLLEAGQSLRIGYAFSSAADNGFSLEGFQVNTVPEPSCLGCLPPMIWGYWWRRKRIASVRLA